MEMNFLTQKRKTTLLGEKPPQTNKNYTFNTLYYQQITQLAGLGGWGVDLSGTISFLDPEARRILDLPPDYKLSFENGMDFYAPEHLQFAKETFEACCQGKEFSIVLKMLTYNQKPFWARAIGAPMRNEKNEIIGIQGAFQNIHAEKEKELHLKKYLHLIEAQNDRMNNFSSLISHNLRSHASNLSLTLELLKGSAILEEDELKSNLFSISEDLNKTLKDIDTIVKAQNNTFKEKSQVSFAGVLENVTQNLQLSLQENETELYYEFSEFPTIEYIESTLENIIYHLISNAITFKHHDRSLNIDIYTTLINNKSRLVVKDNGLGIDLAKNGSKIFNMYQSFGNENCCSGIGLFIVKNQVETMQGTIDVCSELGKGTKFIINF